MALRDGESIVDDTPHLLVLYLHEFIFQMHGFLVVVYDSVFKLLFYGLSCHNFFFNLL